MKNEDIVRLINRPYETESCWEFCREIFLLYDIKLSKLPRDGLKRIKVPRTPLIVLFRCGTDWHSGVVWPDGLHFIHVNLEEAQYVVRKENLTRWPWTTLLEGFYEPA